ncbi:hypothetical protein EEJ42_25365, partial [Streptomyces botrytidirepellens]
PVARALPEPGEPPTAAGPRVRIEAEPPPGAALTPDLPGAPRHEPAAGTEAGQPTGPGRDPRVVRLTVGAADSDDLLRALLAARPPWHIRAVADVPADPDPEAS